MRPTEFDFAVFKYANQTGQDSEVIYRRVDRLPSFCKMGHRDRCTEKQMLDFLEEIVQQDQPSFEYKEFSYE